MLVKKLVCKNADVIKYTFHADISMDGNLIFHVSPYMLQIKNFLNSSMKNYIREEGKKFSTFEKFLVLFRSQHFIYPSVRKS
jgi:hypothetical protein